MPRSSNAYRDSGGIQEGLDRLVSHLNKQAKREVEGTTVRRANHLQRKSELSRQDLLNALHSPASSAVKVNTNASAPKLYFMVGVDSLSDDVVLG